MIMQYSTQGKRHHGGCNGWLQQGVFQLAVFAMLSLGFAQVSGAGVISTYDFTSAEVRQSHTADIGKFLARADVAAELERLGVASEDVMSRVVSLTDQEIAALHGRIEQQVAGGDAIAVIGVVFLVLLILELVGVTDIFKAI
jgi:hypothetical protein